MAGVLAIGAPAAASPASFDLVCHGQTKTGTGEVRPMTMRLSVDGARRRWCYRDVGCGRQFPVISFASGHLVLLAVQTPLNEASLTVDLPAGDLTMTTGIPSRPLAARTSKAQCAMAQFTPLPKP